ncbi:hypothetical protein DFQ28_000261 [Apophysomyces sp. BC1034]|nr:hypothetical protein DFQ30_000497 [Apophysomyces sp. BC1015]KAG0168043.1 hypothetical protein DFQ29_000140 [Apophysomyces sp. BC1021]KAG0184026.1 hypothetical protein DFQ28_000261 [Apophysomyces sp. BC1034]
MRTISLEEVAKHNTKSYDLWLIIHGKVYDLTEFVSQHPGGPNVILKYAGKDATDAYDDIHPPDMVDRYLEAEVCQGIVNAQQLEASKKNKVETEEEVCIRLAREKAPRLDEMYNAFDFESVAKTILKKEAWAYYSAGADDEITMRENHSAFQRIWFRPRVMVNVKHIDTSTTMLGNRVSLPLYISAAALTKLGHPDGEKVLTRAAGRTDIIQMVPVLSSCSMDEIVSTRLENQTQWLQLYVNCDRAITKKLVQDAEKNGFKGLFITVDTPHLGRREKDMRQKYIQAVADALERNEPNEDLNRGAAGTLTAFIDPSLCWDDLQWFQSITNMPILLKGIQTTEDAVRAAKYGCRGVVLSNHGGRQLDFAPSPIEILADVMDALKREGLDKNFEVYIDGGIRRGTDIYKAIALGAKGVGIGRPSLYAMSAYGDDGVVRLIELLQSELEMCMRFMGTPTIPDIKRESVNIRNVKDHFAANPTDYLAKYAYEKMNPRGSYSKL